MKRLLAFTLAGAMLLATPVMAAEDVEDGVVEDVGEDEGTGSKSPGASTVKPKPKKKPVREEATTPVQVVEASSVPAAVTQAAAAEGKTVGEYMNNVIVTVPGLDYAVPIGQGGHVIINGAPSNQVFSVLKPSLANVNSAKAFAAALGGRVLTVGRISASVNGFQTARVNFYMRGVTAGQNIKVFQMVNGQWLEVGVAEIRADHVVVDMTGLGTLAFIAMP
ncbi:MAG: hypothetical protein K2K90_15800 [Lachnospiraceae bacterium]|nr:hypothetical protein [Lachnospiraceae bacterium]